VTFEDVAEWYTTGGYRSATWLELLDLCKWLPEVKVAAAYANAHANANATANASASNSMAGVAPTTTATTATATATATNPSTYGVSAYVDEYDEDNDEGDFAFSESAEAIATTTISNNSNTTTTTNIYDKYDYNYHGDGVASGPIGVGNSGDTELFRIQLIHGIDIILTASDAQFVGKISQFSGLNRLTAVDVASGLRLYANEGYVSRDQFHRFIQDLPFSEEV
jgi:hypothetical protein